MPVRIEYGRRRELSGTRSRRGRRGRRASRAWRPRRALEAGGASCRVLEARDRVGGRTLNDDLGDGKVVEIGGQWVGPTQDRLYELAGELGIDTFPTFIDGENVLELDGKLRRYSGTIPQLNPASLLEIERTRRKLDSRAAQGAAGGALGGRRAPRRSTARRSAPGCDRRMHTRAARRLVEIAVRTVWGADSGDISLLFALWYVRSAGGFDALIDVEGGAQQDRFVGGSQLISLRLAAALARPRRCWARPCAGRATRATGVRRLGRRAAGGRREAGDRRDGAAALRSGSSGSPELPPGAHAAGPADAVGLLPEVHRRLRRALLARRRAHRRGSRQRRRPGDHDLRQLALPTARPASCSRSSAAARRGRSSASARPSAATPCSAGLARAVRAPGPRSRSG